MNQPESVVQKKERGEVNTRQEIASLLVPEVSEALIVRWLTAVKKFGMQDPELADYTLALAHSGKVLDWGKQLSAGKHAPGGVAENTTGPIDSIISACGIYAPIYTGQRLWHTPGTVDRYASIPNFRISLTSSDFEKQMHEIGIAMTAQTSECAPGDGLLYALREKHSRGKPSSENLVQCEEHILASILGKKLASGAKVFGLLMTYGEGAILKDFEAAKSMAERMTSVAGYAGAKISVTYTSMHAPLGDYVSTTSLAIHEIVKFLRGEAVSPDLSEAIFKVATGIICDCGLTNGNKQAAYSKAIDTVQSGRALSKFKEFITAQGANADFCDDLNLLPNSETVQNVTAHRDGYILYTPNVLGMIANELAGDYGTDGFDPSAGLIIDPKARHGQKVSKGQSILTVQGRSGRLAESITKLSEHGFVILDECPTTTARFRTY